MSQTIKTGLVGFFDILGYQNLLMRNEPEKIAEEVLPILTDIKTNGKDDIVKLMNLAKYPTERLKFIVDPNFRTMI